MVDLDWGLIEGFRKTRIDGFLGIIVFVVLGVHQHLVIIVLFFLKNFLILKARGCGIRTINTQFF